MYQVEAMAARDSPRNHAVAIGHNALHGGRTRPELPNLPVAKEENRNTRARKKHGESDSRRSICLVRRSAPQYQTSAPIPILDYSRSRCSNAGRTP
jgi:hypothetical protein